MCFSTEDLYEALDNCIVPGWQSKTGNDELSWTGERVARRIKEMLEILERDEG